jgi:hypothetical protein
MRSSLKYFTRYWYEGDHEADQAVTVEAYWRHIDRIYDRLPPQARTLARDVNLHDGRFRAVIFDRPSRTLEIRLRCGDLQAGYFDLDIAYEEGNLSSTDLAELTSAVTNPESEILYDEIDLETATRYVHRLLPWPRGEINIAFASISYLTLPVSSRNFVVGAEINL